MCSHRDHHQCSTVTDVAQPMYYNQRTVTDIVLSPIQYRHHVVQPMYRYRYRTITNSFVADIVLSPIQLRHRYRTITNSIPSPCSTTNVPSPISYYHRYSFVADIVLSPIQHRHRYRTIINSIPSPYSTTNVPSPVSYYHRYSIVTDEVLSQIDVHHQCTLIFVPPS